MSIKRNIISNGIASALSKTVLVGEQLLLVPFFLSAWGAAYYGEWLTLTIVPSVLAFADLGFGTSAGNAFVLAYSSEQRERAADIYITGFKLVAISVVIGLLISMLVLAVAYYSGFLDKAIISPFDAIVSVMLLMMSRLVSFFNQLYDAFYRSCRRAAMSLNMATISGLVRIAVGITTLCLGFGIVGFSLCQFVVSIVYSIIFAIIGLRLISYMPSGRWRGNIAKDIAGKGLAYLVSPIWQSLYFQGSTLVVRLVLGAEAVAVFNTARTACRSINQAYSVVYSAVFPELQIAFGKNDRILIKKLYRKSLRIEGSIAIFGLLFLLLWGKPLYSWWTRHVLQVPDMMWYILVTGILFNALWFTASMVFKAANQPYRYAVYSISAAIISVFATYLFSNLFGITGAAIGYVTLDMILAFLVIPLANKIVG